MKRLSLVRSLRLHLSLLLGLATMGKSHLVAAEPAPAEPAPAEPAPAAPMPPVDPSLGQPGVGPRYPPPPYGYAFAPPPPSSAPEPLRHGFLALPYLGVHSYMGSAGRDLGPGFRAGSLLGGRINSQLSLNGEISFDVLNLQNVPSGVDASSVDFVVTFSPLLHVPLSSGYAMELVFGPKLGFRGVASIAKFQGSQGSATASGGVGGINVGLFGLLRPAMAVGALLSFDVRGISTTETCSTQQGGSKTCVTDDHPGVDRDKTLAFNAALLF